MWSFFFFRFVVFSLSVFQGLSIVAACAKKDKQWALQVLGNPALVDNEKVLREALLKTFWLLTTAVGGSERS